MGSWNPFKAVKRAAKKTLKEFDRALDRRIGIDDPTIRALTIAGVGAVAGGVIGSAAAGGAYTGGVGLTAGAATNAAVIGGATIGGALSLSALKEQSNIMDTVKQPTFDPFAVDNSAVIGAQEALRKRLANKRGLSSTNVTGGIRSAASGTKPTLFTFA